MSIPSSSHKQKKRQQPPSLEDMCIRNAIDNLDSLGDVGQTESRFLRIILPHCTAQQLTKIENCSEGSDLSSITDDLWQKCYRRKFGDDSANLVVKRMQAKMKDTGKCFKWRALYQAKIREQEEVQSKCVTLLREKYKQAGEQKASRQLQQIDLTPPPSKKRKPLVGGGSISRCGGSSARFGAPSAPNKGRLMKKARQEFQARLIR